MGSNAVRSVIQDLFSHRSKGKPETSSSPFRLKHSDLHIYLQKSLNSKQA